jgi:hypothetical protein
MAGHQRASCAQKFTVHARASAQANAIALLAEDALTDEDIAATVGVSRRMLATWKTQPAFAARLEEAKERLCGEALRYPIARKRDRMRALNDRWQRAQRLLAARAQDPELRAVPGGDTGLLTARPTAAGPAYVVDAALLKEVRELEKQAAIETGEWAERQGQKLDLDYSLRQHIELLSQQTGIPVEEIIRDAEALITREAAKQLGVGGGFPALLAPVRLRREGVLGS